MGKLQNRTIGGAVRARVGLVAAVLVAALTFFSAPTPVSAQGLPLIRDTEIENLLNDYARPIFKAAGLGEGRVAVRIVRSDIFNAFVLDGRNVFIHTGALMQAETPNQIIGVIAHEAGHIAGGHLAALRSRIARDQTRALLIRMLGLGVAIATGAGEAVFAGDELIMRSLLAERRSQEAAADQAGLRYLNATGQSGRGMLETFERFAQQEYISDTYKDPFVRSHPVATDRLARLRELVQNSPYYNVTDPPQLQLRHDMMRAKLAGYLERPQVVFNRYPRSDTSLPARYARAIATFMQGGQSALPAALEQVDALIRERPDNPYFHELKADFLTRSGKSREAIAPLRQALRLSKGASLIRVQLASALLATNDPKVVGEAADLLRKSIIEDENPRAYRSLADAYYRLGRQAEADAAIAQAYFLEGDVKQAQNFATRAQRALRQGSPTWLKMDDIINYKSSSDL
jgi:predicted Zn-dependent protease